MNVSEALLGRRTIRKFAQKPVSHSSLERLIDYARLAPFAANIQALRYRAITDITLCERIFQNLKWAGYIEQGAPKKELRPTAYIAVLGDTTIKESFETDAGAAITAMLLGAHEMGLGACWIGSINRRRVLKLLDLPSKYSLLYIVALGYPAEESKEVPYKGSQKYFYDENAVLNVPKLSLADIMI